MSENNDLKVVGGSFIVTEFTPEDIFTPEDFNEEQQMIGQMAKEFNENEIGSVIDRLEKREEGLMAAKMKEAGELGLLGVDVPERFDGLGATKSLVAKVTEGMSTLGSFATAYGAHTGIGTLPILYFGTEELKAKYVAKLASGEFLGAYALTEPGSGSDALSAKATAVVDGDDFILNGTKQFITNAAFADVFIVFAQVDGDKFTAFVIDAGTEGLSIGPEEDKLGIKGSSTCQVIMENVRIPKSQLLGEIGKGHRIAFNVLNIGRLKLGAGAVGGMKKSVEQSVQYAQERHQFNKPLIAFGLIREKVAKMASKIFGTESTLYRTTGLMDLRYSKIDHDADDVNEQLLKMLEEYAIECSMIKVLGSENLDFAVDEMVQIYGGYGYSEEYPAARAYRDSRINRIYEGTSEINRMVIPAMLFRKAMKGELPLMQEAMKVMDDLFALPDLSESVEVLGEEMKSIGKLKKLALMVSGAAVQKYGEDLKKEQEVLAHIADICIAVYALESTVLRAKKLIASGHARTELAEKLAVLYCREAAMMAAVGANEALAHIESGDQLRTMMAVTRRYTKLPPVDSVLLRREVAKEIAEAGGYPF